MSKKKNYALVKVDFLRVRDEPKSEGSNVLAQVRENSYWYFTGTQSKEKEKLTIRGQEHDDYWYLINIDNCVKGWVYGGAVEFDECPNKPNIAPKIYFSQGVIEELGADKIKETEELLTAFDKIKTAKDLFAYYNTKEDELSTIWSYDKLEAQGDFLNCVTTIFEYTMICSECGNQLYSLNNTFFEKAKETTDKLDDALFQLLLDAVGDYNSFDIPSFSAHDCDFCWHSNLGDGTILLLFKRLNEIWATYDKLGNNDLNLQPILEKLENYLFLIINSDTYMNSQKKVLSEYDKIAAIFLGRGLDSSRLAKFKNLKEKLSKGEGLIFDCKEKDCATMVMEEAFPNN